MTSSEAFAIAIQHHRGGRLQAAEQIYREILQTEPDHPDALHLLGLIAHQSGHHELAAEQIERAVRVKGSEADFHYNLAKVYRALGRAPAAIACYRRALELRPDSAAAYADLGAALFEQGATEEAVSSFRRALALKPDLAGAHNNLGNALREQGKLDEAVACFRRALELEPGLAELHNNLGLALAHQEKPEAAVACFRRALGLKPDLVEAHNNLGNALMEQGALDDAIASFQRALALAPDSALAHNNLGNAFKAQRNLMAALSCYRRALELSPDAPRVRSNLGLVLLLLGRHEEGWRESEHRLADPATRRTFSKPRWNGEPAAGRTLLLYCEQGYGDALQFVRYAPLVRQRAGAERILLETPPALARLFARESRRWQVEILPARGPDETLLPPFDAQIPLMSLPLALGLFEPLALDGGYLQADPELRQKWRGLLGPASAVRVGLVWSGNLENKLGRLRSMPGEKLLPLLQSSGFQFYSLQLGRRSQPLEAAGVIDLTADLTDFADTAALLAELDLVISIDTSVAHLAGALGRPVWTLLPFVPDWRWGLDCESTPWYPAMRLFRQPRRGDWDSVIRQVAEALHDFTRGKE